MNNFLQRAPIFGQEFDILRSNPNFSTASDTYVDALSFTIPNASAGQYILMWSYRHNNSKSNTTSQTQARFNDLAVITNTVAGQSSLGGALGEQFTGFAEFTVLDGDLKISLAIQRTAGNGSGRINSMNICAYRVG